MVGITTLSRLDAGAQALRLRLDTLTRQQSAGFKGPGYGDIAPDARRAIDLRADMARREAWQGTIDRTLARTSVTQNALGRLSDIATNFYEQAITIDGTNGVLVSSIAAQARAAMEEVANLLNERYGGEYVFGGTDTANPPVPDAQGIMNSGMATRHRRGGRLALLGQCGGCRCGDAGGRDLGCRGHHAVLGFPVRPGGRRWRRRGARCRRPRAQRVDYGILANRNAGGHQRGRDHRLLGARPAARAGDARRARPVADRRSAPTSLTWSRPRATGCAARSTRWARNAARSAPPRSGWARSRSGTAMSR